MWDKIKQTAKAVYNYIASRPADTWLHIFAGQLIGFILFAIGVWFWICFVVGGLVGIGKEIWDSRHSESHTPEWRDAVNTAIGAVIGALMALM